MANTKITSANLDTLTTLTVDDITIDGSTISDSGDLTLDVGGDIILDAAGGDIILKNAGSTNGNIVLGDATNPTVTISSGFNFTLDIGANIVLDADGGEIQLKDGGTEFGQLVKSGNDFRINQAIQDGDIVFRGNDGGSIITALTIDMSDAGSAIFNNKVGIGTANPASLLHIESATNTAITIQAGTNSSASLRLKNDAVDFDVNVQTNDNFALYNHTYNKQPITVTPQGYMTLQHEGSDFGLQIRTNGSTRSGLVIDKPNTSTILGSLLVLSDESYRIGTASHYHMVMLQNGQTTLYGDDTAVQLGVDGTGMFSNKNRYRFTDTTGGEYEVRSGGRNGTGTYTLFTNGASNTQSAGIVEVWGIYGTPSNASYTKYVISGNRSITTVISEVETGTVPTATVAWSGSALQVSNSNSSLYYHVRVELHDIGYGWSATWGNFPGMG